MPHGEVRSCRVSFHGSAFCADARSEVAAAAAAAVEATIYFWHLTLKLTLCDGSGPTTPPPQHQSDWSSLFVLYWVIIMDTLYNRDWGSQDTVSDLMFVFVMYYFTGQNLTKGQIVRGWSSVIHTVAYSFISLHAFICGVWHFGTID